MSEHQQRPRPLVLAVLDGWGTREEKHGNAIAAADLPNWRRILENLPEHADRGQRWRSRRPSERRHWREQRGRPHQHRERQGRPARRGRDRRRDRRGYVCEKPGSVANDRPRQGARGSGSPLRFALRRMRAQLPDAPRYAHRRRYPRRCITRCGVHSFLDGRDVPPRSALLRRAPAEESSTQSGRHPGSIATVIGRFYAMDRDKRWDRTELAQQHDASLARGSRAAVLGPAPRLKPRSRLPTRATKTTSSCSRRSSVKRVRCATATRSSSSTSARTGHAR